MRIYRDGEGRESRWLLQQQQQQQEAWMEMPAFGLFAREEGETRGELLMFT
jgi:hypothetical protein